MDETIGFIISSAHDGRLPAGTMNTGWAALDLFILTLRRNWFLLSLPALTPLILIAREKVALNLKLVLVNLSAVVLLSVSVATDASPGAEPVSWSALRPSDQSNSRFPLPGIASNHLQGETLAWQDETLRIELTGFILPIDQEGDLVYEFMLVPWAGACSHSAPPPPNQLVHVVSDEPFHILRVYEVITVTGSLRPGLDRAQLFIMDGVRVLDYSYSMSHAKVARANDIIDPDLRSVSPFGILAR